MVGILILYGFFKLYPPFWNNQKLQRFSPLFVIIFILPMIVKIPFNISKPLPHILGLLLIIFSIWGVIRNFKKKPGSSKTD
jgi:hypothetical protein